MTISKLKKPFVEKCYDKLGIERFEEINEDYWRTPYTEHLKELAKYSWQPEAIPCGCISWELIIIPVLTLCLLMLLLF